MRRTLRMSLLAHPGRAVDPVPAPISLADDVLSAPVSLEAIEIPAAANDVGSGGGVRITAVTAVGALPQASLSIVGTAPSQRIRIERAGLAVGTYVGTYDAELVSDPSIGAVADFTLNLTSTALSSIIVTAPIPAIRAEGNSGTKSIAFIVSRQGDLSQACSVQWALEGDLNTADMAAGQATSGPLNWAANDGTARTVTIVVKGDTTVEPDEVCRIRISSPVGCTIGTATATVTIQNDDSSTTPADYAEDLGFGGLMLGTACHDGEPGNTFVRNDPGGYGTQHAIVMYLESRKKIWCVSTEIRVDHFPLGSTAGGYSDRATVRVVSSNLVREARKGDVLSNPDPTKKEVLVTMVQDAMGGDLRIQVAKVTSAETGTGKLQFGDVVGSTARIDRCARPDNWGQEWADCGGTGAVPDSFVQYPTIWFRDGDGNLAPIDPVARGWKIGDRIAFLVQNLASDNGIGNDKPDARAPPYGNTRYFSINHGFRRDRPDVERSSYRYMRNVGAWWGSYTMEPEYFPTFLIGHRSGNSGPFLVKGNPYVGLAGSGDRAITKGTQWRQMFRIPAGWSGRRIVAADVSLWRAANGGSTGSITIAIYKAGSSLGGGSDNGTLLGSRNVAASSLREVAVSSTGDPNIKFNIPRNYEPHQRVSLAEPYAVEPGEGYYVVLTPSSGANDNGRYVFGLVLQQFRATRGLIEPNYVDRSCTYQSKVGSAAWTNQTYRPTSGWYTHLGIGLHFDAGA